MTRCRTFAFPGLLAAVACLAPLSAVAQLKPIVSPAPPFRGATVDGMFDSGAYRNRIPIVVGWLRDLGPG